MIVPTEHPEMLQQLERRQARLEQVAFKFGIRDPEDVFQEIGVRCCQSATQINWSEDQTGWLITVAKNIAIDHSRRCRVRREIGGVEASDFEDHSARHPPRISETKLVAIHQAIDCLRPSIRIAIRAKFWDHRPDEDVAHELGVTAAAVRQMRSRGLKQIKVALCRQQLGDLCD